MKLFLLAMGCLGITTVHAQVFLEDISMTDAGNIMNASPPPATIYPLKKEKWKMNRNKYWTGGLMFLAGASKGFNEGLQYQYNGFASFFPRANKQWFYPGFSFRNKYKDGDPKKGPRFPFSTSMLVMLTDQYHLNNFIQRASITGAMVIKLGEPRRPFKHYLMDFLYYSACYQGGFHSIYSPIRARNRK